MAMNPEVKADWVKALRSGDYDQGRNRLRGEDGYCCLGVLCELAVRAGVIPAAKPLGASYEYDRETAFPSEKVYKWAGITDRPGLNEDVISDLIGYNDEGKNFAFIADQIERRL